MTLFKERYPPPDVSDEGAFRQWLITAIYHMDDCFDKLRAEVQKTMAWQNQADEAALLEAGARAQRKKDEVANQERLEKRHSLIRAGYDVVKEVANSGFFIGAALVLGGAIVKVIGL